MGRLGWILLTGAAMAGGIALHSEDVQSEMSVTHERIEAQSEDVETRLEDIEARLERRAEEIADRIERDADAIDRETDEDGELREATPGPAEEAEGDADRIAQVTAELERLKNAGLLTQDEYETLIARLDNPAAE